MIYVLLHPISSLNHFVARLLTDQISLFIALAFFIYLAFNYKTPYWQSLDKKVCEWVEKSGSNTLKARSEDFAFFGNAVFHISYSIVLSIILFTVRHKLTLVYSILFALIFSWGLNRLLKLIFRRERPENISGNVRKRMSFCFPSGHVMASIPIYFFSAVLLQSFITFVPWYLIALVISAFVVMSRIYLNHHYFTDVLGGIAAGIICLNISIWFYFLGGLL